jgi:hypothetical protein
MKTIDFIIQSVWMLGVFGFAIFGNDQTNDHSTISGYYFRFGGLLMFTLLWQFTSHAINNTQRARTKRTGFNSHVQQLVLLGYVLLGVVTLFITGLTGMNSIMMKVWLYLGMPVVAFGWIVCSVNMRDSWDHFREFGHEQQQCNNQQQQFNQQQYMNQQYMQQQQFMQQQQQQQFGNQQFGNQQRHA